MRAREDDHATRTRLGLPPRYFLASARFIRKKNLQNLLTAFAEYRSKLGNNNACDLVILGDGPFKPALLEQRRALALESFVFFPGFRQYDELPLYYGLASAFVHPSLSEPWGLVVNEALAAGLPVIVSQQSGCARDLVIDGENGFQFDANDSHALGSLLARMTSMSPAELSAMGKKGKKIVDDWSPDNFGKQFELAAIAARKSIPRRANLLDDVLLRILIARYNSTAAKLLPVRRSATAG
jgi:glycosyltransferase involved in cell wall biosynthesis